MVGCNVDAMEFDAIEALPVYVQPLLQMTAATAAKIDAGEAYRIGGAVRQYGTGQIVELLEDAPDIEEVVEEVAKQLKELRVSKFDMSKIELPKLDPKTAAKLVGVVLVVGLAVGGFMWARDRRKASQAAVPAEALVEVQPVDGAVKDPECLVSFRASLKAYVDAGLEGRLDSDIVAQLVAALDAMEAYSDEGNIVMFTLDEFMPFFELVTAHTTHLAQAQSVDLDDLDEHEDNAEGRVVVSMRRHLETQKKILGEVA